MSSEANAGMSQWGEMVLEGIRAGFGVWTHGMKDDNKELKNSGKKREKCDEVWRHYVAEVSTDKNHTET